jgi:hypothetical protein
MSSEKLDKKENQLPETWRNAVDSMTVEELKNSVSVETKRSDDNDRALLDDAEVGLAKDKLDNLTAGYKEIKKDAAIKIRYLIKKYKEKTI